MSNSPSLVAKNRERILETAEKLFAQQGIDGVSLRYLSEVTGQKNKTAIQYHFGNKEGLARAVIHRRSAIMEPVIRRMYESALNEGRLRDLRTIIEILYRPISEIVDENGFHVYAGFLLHFLNHRDFNRESFDFGWTENWHDLSVEHLENMFPDFGHEQIITRLYILNGMFVPSLVRLDSMRKSGGETVSTPVFLDMLFNMMAAAFSARPSENVLDREGGQL